MFFFEIAQVQDSKNIKSMFTAGAKVHERSRYLKPTKKLGNPIDAPAAIETAPQCAELP